MELMMKFVLGTAGTIVLGLVTNFISDKIKNHSSNCDRKSGYEFEIKLLEFKFKKK